MIPEDPTCLWFVVVGFIIAFVLAFGIGANDVANSFGTSVGSKVLTLFQACIIASIFELAGAILIGSKVSETVRKGIIDMTVFNGTEKLAMAGAMSALTGTSVWLIIATFFNLPVSGTHSIVGSTIGYAFVAIGAKNIKWATFGKIAASWVISPVLSGSISSGIFVIIDRFILKSETQLRNGLIALPFLTGCTIFINSFSILFSQKEVFGLGSLEWWHILLACMGGSLLIAGVGAVFVNPWLKKKIINKTETVSAKYTEEGSPDSNGIGKKDSRESDPEEINPLMEDPNEEITNHAVTTKAQVEIITKDSRESNPSETDNLEPEVKILYHDREVIVEVEKKVEEKKQKNGFCKDENGVIENGQIAEHEQNGILKNKIETNGDTIHYDDAQDLECNGIDGPRPVRSRSVMSYVSDIMKNPDNSRELIKDDPASAELFKYLQIITATFGSFAHGGNDVSNAIGPVISLWLIYKTGEVITQATTPIWILVYGGAGIIVGLCVWGRRVIKTIGENLSPITPSSGFAIEIGAALTVLLASNLGLPVSTTHCKVGSVVFVGRVRSKEVVDWSLFGSIVVSWIVTMPITGGISAAVFAIIREVM